MEPCKNNIENNAKVSVELMLYETSKDGARLNYLKQIKALLR